MTALSQSYNRNLENDKKTLTRYVKTFDYENKKREYQRNTKTFYIY